MGKIVRFFFIVTVFLFTVTPTAPAQASTADSGSSTMIISLGEEFTLKKGETARVKGLNVFLKVIDFYYAPCPKNVKCVWSGLAVNYELTVDGKVYVSSLGHSPYEAPYDALVKKTDYKTYATFVINRPEVTCTTSRNQISQDWCWKLLANRLKDQTYCSKISDLTIKDACFEEMAEKLSDSNLCKNVISPRRYCQYLKLVSQNALAGCDNIIVSRWRINCFREIVKKSGQGINACDTLEPNKATSCRKAILGQDY